MKLTDLLQEPEGKMLEFKRDLSSPEGPLKTLIAFANTSGGTLLIGIEDSTRRVRGVANVLKEEERLASLIVDSIRPQLIPDIEIVSWRKLQVLVVRVYPSNTRPHHLASLGPETGTFVRVGSTNCKAAPPQIEELRRLNRMDSFDEQAVPESNSEALDFRLASELFSEYKKLTPIMFQTLRVVTRHQGRLVPTIGGLLLFGKDRFPHFPDAWIQAGRFAGTTKARILDSRDIRTPLAIAISEAIAFAQKHLTLESIIEGERRHERWSIPPVVIREAIINAVVHADYAQSGAPIRLAVFDDRIEIENPGLLPFGLTLVDLQDGTSKLRNRVIGRVFQELHLIEHWGSGIPRMNEACDQAGLPRPKLEELAAHFRVTIYNHRVSPVLLDEMDTKILQVLKVEGMSGTAAVARAVKISSRSVLTRLQSLKARGLVLEIGTGPHDPKRQYAIATVSKRRR